MELGKLIHILPREESLRVSPRPYFNHSVEFKKVCSAGERAAMMEKVGLNVFLFPSEMITGCDLLSDSGVTTMTNEQWAALHLGDEAYGSNRGFFILRERIRALFGEEFFGAPESTVPNAFIFHQGRPSEDALFSILGRVSKGFVVPSNGHFDTTQGNIEVNDMQALNLFSPELSDESSKAHFKGNMDVEALRKLLSDSAERVPLIYLTITNNTGGGQPVSLSNIREVSNIAHEYGIPLFFDACRFAENAWFIKRFEAGHGERSIEEIVREMFSCVDGFTISFKKDGLVNMGGGLFLRNDGLFIEKYPHIPDELFDYQIMKEGHPTYGGLSGREIMALCEGLRLAVDERYLTHRIEQVRSFGEGMKEAGLPVMSPFGGHAVYLDVNRFFEGTRMRPEDFGGIAFTAVLLAAYGHRACELGYFAFGHYDRRLKKEVLPAVNFVRFAVPRLRYEMQDLAGVAEAVRVLYEKRDAIPPVEVTFGRDLPMRHFKARFRFVE